MARSSSTSRVPLSNQRDSLKDETAAGSVEVDDMRKMQRILTIALGSLAILAMQVAPTLAALRNP